MYATNIHSSFNLLVDLFVGFVHLPLYQPFLTYAKLSFLQRNSTIIISIACVDYSILLSNLLPTQYIVILLSPPCFRESASYWFCPLSYPSISYSYVPNQKRKEKKNAYGPSFSLLVSVRRVCFVIIAFALGCV